ncbi:hypothetical protein, partial [uncultured Methylobacterium sp.]|uniref:hypothetical protein n=1 Tax=uncultured Methylobacterium sp. TaxID=157278 RepID=UPI00262C7C15
TAGVDKLEVQLSGVIDPSQVGFKSAAAMPGSASAPGLFYNTSNGGLWWEPGGPSSGNVLLTMLSGNPTLTAGDITVV